MVERTSQLGKRRGNHIRLCFQSLNKTSFTLEIVGHEGQSAIHLDLRLCGP